MELFRKKPKGKDIELPLKPGQRRDPRLGKKRMTVAEGFEEAKKGWELLKQKRKELGLDKKKETTVSKSKY